MSAKRVIRVNGVEPHHLANAIREALVFKGKPDLIKEVSSDWWQRLAKREQKPDPKLALVVEKVVKSYVQLRSEHAYKSEPLARMVKGETLRKVTINSPGRVAISIMDDLNFCVDYMVKNAGKSSIYRLV